MLGANAQPLSPGRGGSYISPCVTASLAAREFSAPPSGSGDPIHCPLAILSTIGQLHQYRVSSQSGPIRRSCIRVQSDVYVIIRSDQLTLQYVDQSRSGPIRVHQTLHK